MKPAIHFAVSDLPILPEVSMNTHGESEQPPWLFSRHGDFWLASGGASAALFASLMVIFWHGDRELDALDFVFSELHLGATYGAIVQRRLWRQRHLDVLVVPLIILALTYALSMTGQTLLLTSIAMYAAVWHRGRQSLGVASFYQRGMGGPVSPAHKVLFRGAIYLPMLAATLAYTHLAPAEYDGEAYFALSAGAGITSLVGSAATLWVIAYLSWTLRHSSGAPPIRKTQHSGLQIHPGERWIVFAHAVAFGSAYVLGASNASFILVLAVHHEVQYLYFAWAMVRRSASLDVRKTTGVLIMSEPDAKALPEPTQPAVKLAAAFLLWPIIGFVGAVLGGWLQLAWLAPLGMGGLFCHYWLDGRIWTRRSFQK